MKCQNLFSGRNMKHTINFACAEFAHGVVNARKFITKHSIV